MELRKWLGVRLRKPRSAARRPVRLTLESCEDRTAPAVYAVTLLSPAVGEPGETAAAHAGELRVNPALPTFDGEQAVGAATPADAIRAALIGTVSISVGGQSASYSFGRDTAGHSATDRKPYRVEVAGTEGRVWLEDLAGQPGPDWDYNDRSWRVSVRRLSGDGDTGTSGGTVSTFSSPIDEDQFTWVNEFGETATVDYEVNWYDESTYLWQYAVTNNNLSVSSPNNRGVVFVSIGVGAGVEVFDTQVVSGVTSWQADPDYPYWYGDTIAGPFLAPGQTAVFTFKTAPVPIIPMTGAAAVHARIPSLAEGPARGPGAVPSGDLDLIDSAGNEVADDKEDDNPGPGGWVPVNNDNDNYNFIAISPEAAQFSLAHQYDKDETGQVIGENDLIKIRVHDLTPAVGGNYTLNWTSPKIKVWQLSDKSGGQVTSGTVMQAGQTTDLWVEGLSLSATAMSEEIKLVWTGDNSVVDRVNLTVYEVTGAMNVPGYSSHTYYFKYPGPHRADARWGPTVFGGQYHLGFGIPPTTQDGYTTDGHVILWGEGGGNDGQGYQIDMPNGFSVLREVNVVKVNLDFANQANNKIEFNENNVSITFPGNIAAQVESSKGYPGSGNPPFITATLRVTGVEGPLVRGQRRGERFLEIGWMQSVRWTGRHADFWGFDPDKVNKWNNEGNTYNDSTNLDPNVSAAWTYYGDTNPERFLAIGTDDNPANDDRLFVMRDAPSGLMTDKLKVTAGGVTHYVNFISHVRDFWTYFGVRTLETVNAANQSYTIRAEVAWELDASVFVTVAVLPDGSILPAENRGNLGSYAKGHGGGDKPTQFADVQDGRIFSVPLNPTANSVPPSGWTVV